MTYIEHTTLPAYERSRFGDGKPFREDVANWSGPETIPEIGDEIEINFNNLGRAVVTGYFTEGGWLGLKVRIIDPPTWHVIQNKGDPNGHVFGAEMAWPSAATH